MNEPIAIRTRQLRKEYDSVTALRALDLEIPEGEIFGLIGPNGAGKSTLLKILATALKPDFGTAAVAGFDVGTDPMQVRKSAGFMPDFFALYESVTAEDFLTYFGLAFDCGRETVSRRVEALLEAVNLADKRSAMISELSRGMRQRLVFAKTLIHDPKVLLLDEPLSGLDPKARAEMREIMRGLRTQGKTVIISSHILSELSDLCTSIGILEKGELKVSGPVAEISMAVQGGRRVTVEVTGDRERAVQIIGGFEGVKLLPRQELEAIIRFKLAADRKIIAQINKALVAADIGVLALWEERDNLEEIYFQVSSHEVQ